MHHTAVLPRSFLYVPADRPELFAKACNGPADALIFDLEDAVPLGRKDEARRALRDWLAANPTSRQQIWVRINQASIMADLQAVVSPGLTGIMQAKCSPAVLLEATAALTDLERSRGLEPIGIIGLVEDARSLQALDSMATNPRLVTFAIGEVDLMADLRMARTLAAEPALDSIRARFVIACAAAGLRPPLAPTSTAIRELDAFEQSSQKMLNLGFRSRTAIHPAQLAVIHAVFSPSLAELAAARDVIDRFDLAGGGVALDVAGRMIDAAVVRGAQETLSRTAERND
ncbi:CoA ester lyase [Cryobacterium sp. Y82]|uniref:HpcH/HpaI aldolase/citrate lyase family protein n=1 Tax=Cryobacterium sp. Y82 TaxID=2045017 RepID=UPI000CE2D8BD|nr:CoA ester lyase [Cryobacterium sp. Y82]